jgi:hypothetical protein
MTSAAAISLPALREHIVTANYPKAAETFCALIKEGVPLHRLVKETVEVTAPFVQAPSHMMTRPDGTARGVNYDHTVLGWRASLRLMPALPEPANLLPVTQAIWYVPQGLDVWSQITCDFPGHYARDQERCDDREHLPPYDPPVSFDGPAWQTPKVHFEDHPPLLDGPAEERLERMRWAIVNGERVEAYRLFLGLAEEPAMRTALKDAILLAGISDLQSTIIQRGGYQNIGHKALRARALVSLADWLGWENSHDVYYTVVPDLGCMPRFYDLWSLTSLLLPQEFKNWAPAPTFPIGPSAVLIRIPSRRRPKCTTASSSVRRDSPASAGRASIRNRAASNSGRFESPTQNAPVAKSSISAIAAASSPSEGASSSRRRVSSASSIDSVTALAAASSERRVSGARPGRWLSIVSASSVCRSIAIDSSIAMICSERRSAARSCSSRASSSSRCRWSSLRKADSSAAAAKSSILRASTTVDGCGSATPRLGLRRR